MKKTIKFTSVLGLILILIVAYYAHKKRISIYNYDRSKSYNFNFQDSDAKIFDLKLDNNTLVLPDFKGDNYSAFLKIEINTTLLGKFFNPEINISYKNKRISQQFEIGASGIRYINISEAVNAGADTLQFEAKYTDINNENTNLYLFENENLTGKKTLILSPHPDDAEIAAYGLYSTHPKNTYIVTITAGNAGDFKYDEIFNDSLTHYKEKGRVRTWNSITVPLLGGISPENIMNLGYSDETLPLMYQKDSIPIQNRFTKTTGLTLFRSQNQNNLISGFNPATSTWKSLVNDIKQLLDTIQPDIIITPYPKFDRHLDHKYTTIALLQAIKSLNLRKGKLLLYTNHLPESDAYPFGEQGQPITLPPNFDDSTYFTSILSFPLSKKAQQQKILALDAMNDLRMDTEYLNTKSAFIYALKVLKRNTLGPDIDYFRRSVRANELFFVMSISNIYNDEIAEHTLGNPD